MTHGRIYGMWGRGTMYVVVSGKNGTTGQVTTLRYQVDAKELDVEMMNAQDCKVLKVIEQ